MEKVKSKINDKFLPYNFINHEAEHDEKNLFSYLHELSVNHSNLPDLGGQKMTGETHFAHYQSLSEEGLNNIFSLTVRNPELIFNDDVIAMIDSVLTDEVDKELKAYLGSNYAVMSYKIRSLTKEDAVTNPSTRWHCDSSPSKSAMVMCYLNDTAHHDSSTLFLNVDATNRLKDLGYVYCFLKDRRENIDDILSHYQLDQTTYRHEYKAGETVVFGATRVLHRAEPPKPGSTRTTLDLAIIPSPVPWKEAINCGYIPSNVPIDYVSQAQRLLQAVNMFDANKAQPPITDNVIQIPVTGGIINKESLKFHIDSIFKNKEYANGLYEQFIKVNINFNTLTINEFILLLKASFKDGLNWGKSFNTSDVENLSDLIAYEKRYQQSAYCFALQTKPKPDAVMWPIPNHPKYPKCKFDMTPFVVSEKIMDMNTPIGSAGSCFAVEIAQVLQEEKFNYVITELGDNPKEEAIIDGYKFGSGIAMYSANFGILFNTPSLRQIAEKAFGEREFNQYLTQTDSGLYMDPYRENVYFSSKENYLWDYPKHVEAIKQTLLQSEVFIFTAGLNECWQLVDGTVISRNPRDGFYHLMKHKVLTVEENIENIMSFFNIVKRHNPKFKLILTLSPVPLLATGRGDTHHILEANTHSKAVLRVAIEEVVKQHKDIHYLPSYELVTECMPNPWKEDHRHVTPDTVSRVIAMFKEMFVL